MQHEMILRQPDPAKALTAIVGTAIALSCSGAAAEDFMKAVVDIAKIAKDVHDKNILNIHPGVGNA